MYSTLADDNSDHKKAKGVNRNVAATISHNEYKDVLLNNKYLRYSLKRIQSKDHRVITYEINKSFIALFYWQNIYSKHLIWWMSSWLSEWIRKKQLS